MTKPRRSLESRGKSTFYVTTGGAGYVSPVATSDFVDNAVKRGKKAFNIGKSATLAIGSYIKDKVTGKPDAERNAGLTYLKNLNKENQKEALDVAMHSSRGADVISGDAMLECVVPNYIKKLVGKNIDINYTGNVNDFGGANLRRDLVNLYLNGDTTGFEDVTDNERYSHGPDYKRYFEKYYPGVKPKIYKMSSDGVPLELNEEEIDYANRNLNKSTQADDLYAEGGDNVGHYNRWYKNIDGQLYAIDSDVWDFNPKDWHWEGDDNETVNKFGTPFILKAIRPVKLKEREKIVTLKNRTKQRNGGKTMPKPRRTLESKGKSTPYVTTGGAGYVPPATNVSKLINKNEVRKRLYDNIYPFEYNNALSRVANAVIFNKGEGPNGEQVYLPEVDDLWATYLQIPKNQRHSKNKMDAEPVKVMPATYKPTKSNSNGNYYKLSLTDIDKQALVDEAFGKTYDEGFDVSLNPYNNKIGLLKSKRSPLKIGENRVALSSSRNLNTALRDFTVGRGYDNKGDYVSYYDLWDLSPYRYSNKDQSHGIGKPFEVYDRVYLDDYYGVKEPTRSTYLPEVVVEGRSKHKYGGIHIAPSKKGTFTAAATKHGMGVQEFAARVLRNKSNYSPSLVKKANFARNASKWNH